MRGRKPELTGDPSTVTGIAPPASQQTAPADVAVGSCVTSIAGPNGDAQLYERWRWALRGRQSGADFKPPQAAVVKKCE
jgi:hypothetical protein